MKKIIFFDLEQTLIPDWFEDRQTLLPLMHPDLKEWIFSQFPFTAGLLSFAVWNNKDLTTFNQELRPLIEEHLFFKFDDDLIFTSHHVREWINEWNKTPWETADDNASTFKKNGIMNIIWKNKFIEDDTHVILLDDTIDDMVVSRTSVLQSSNGNFTHSVPVRNNILEFVNPWSIIRGLR